MVKKIRIQVLSAVSLVLLIVAVNVHAQGATGTAANRGEEFIMADEAPNNVAETLIDFSEFQKNLRASGLYVEKDSAREKALPELSGDEIDPDTLLPIYKVEYGDFDYDEWVVSLNSSADTSNTRRWSFARKAQLKDGTEVLGVRVNFPKTKYNANASISPQYELRAYDNVGTVVSRRKTGKKIGVIDNVGNIKKMTLEVSGRNYKYGVAVRLRDTFDNVREYFMGYIYFVNWRRLMWENPHYIEDVRLRDIYKVPLYPREFPYVKFDSIVVYKPGQSAGGDSVFYFKKIDLWFDYAISPTYVAEVDIDDEGTWGILRARALKRRNIERKRMRERIELIREEERRAGRNRLGGDKDNQGAGGASAGGRTGGRTGGSAAGGP